MKQLLCNVLVAAALTTLASGICFKKRSHTQDAIFGQCFNSLNFTAELELLSGEIAGLSVGMSDIPTLKNDSFARFGKTLWALALVRTGIREIEDNALRNLTGLRVLYIRGNQLETVRAVWFRNVPQLEMLALTDNRIKQIEPEISLPNLETLNLDKNELRCIPMRFLSQFKVMEQIVVSYNPLTYRCHYSLFEWFKTSGVDYKSWNVLDVVANATRSCLESFASAASVRDDLLNRCVESKFAEDFTKAVLLLKAVA